MVLILKMQSHSNWLPMVSNLISVKKQKIGELDFAIEMNGQVVPIEVKSGKAYKSHKSVG